MKLNSFLFILISSISISANSYGQGVILEPGKTTEKKLLKGENHLYTISLQKGEYAECVIMQKSVDVGIDVNDPSGKKIKTFDSPNGKEGPEPVTIKALQTGKYQLHIYPMIEQDGMPDSAKARWAEEDQGDYAVTDVTKLSVSGYKQKLVVIQKDKDQFAQWISKNAHHLKTIDAGNGFEDLEPFSQILKDVQVVGLGEASHGTSEFFRMKHRMLEYLVKEKGFVSFYIEASMTRCRLY